MALSTIGTNSIANDAVTAAKATGIGITMVDQWRITSDTSSTGDFFITSNWERVDTDGFGQLGTGMTESSGVFSFPSTGIYLIRLQVTYITAAADAVECNIQTTVDNSSYSHASVTRGDSNEDTLGFTLYAEHLFDVTNTSTHKVKFYAVSVSSGSYFRGETGKTMTGATFVRLGDT
tara:strand:- start:853 stop:1383 length:531 start_codon:yes stop_codon:yes gene_type:complete